MDYKFRTKNNGINSSDERAVFSDGTNLDISNYLNRYNPLYHSRLIVRPSCNNCIFCSINRCSDITIGDFSKNEISLSFNRLGGVSTLLLNTERGYKLFDEIKNNTEFQVVDLETVSQIRLKEHGIKNPKQEEFFENLKRKNIDFAIFKWMGLSRYIKVIAYNTLVSLKSIFNDRVDV